MLRALLTLTLFTSLVIPRSGTKIIGIPITIPILLYALVFVLWIIRPLSSVKLRWRAMGLFPGLAIWAIAAYLLAGMASLCLGVGSGSDWKAILVDAAFMFGFVPMFFMMKDYAQREYALPRTARLICGSVLVVCCYGIVQYVFGYGKTMIPGVTICYTDAHIPSILEAKSNLTAVGLKLTSTFQNGNLYGNFLVLMLPVVVALSVVSRGATRWLCLLTIFLGLGNLVLTLSRGAIISGVLSIALLAWLLRPARIPIVTAGLMAAIGSILVMKLHLAERLLVFDPTAGGRMSVWTDLLSNYERMPVLEFARVVLFGAGLGGCIHVPFGELAAIEGSLIMITMKAGMFALLAFTIATYAVFRCGTGYKTTNKMEKIILCGFATGLIGAYAHFAMDSVMVLPPTAMNFWAVMGLIAGKVYKP